MYDLIIVGAGPAGITAAIYAVRKRIESLVITRDIGGQTALSGDVENYTGYQFITGPELVLKFEEHLRKFNIALKENEAIRIVEKTGPFIQVKTDKALYESKSVIIASGKRSRELNVPGEKEFKNKGLTYCATCDGPLFSGKDVAIIGGGNSALDAAIQLMKIANKVYIVNIAPELTGDAVMREAVQGSDKVSVLNNTNVEEVLGARMVSGIRIKKDGAQSLLSVQGVFVEIGLIPNSDFISGVNKNSSGEIIVNSRNETNIPGIFAAGDVTDVPEKQIVIAAGEGAKAALGVFKYLIYH
ncbi:MAG: FAD-dependent oxidoreductase [Candidatus Omnitrophota bacterium]